MIRIRRPNEAPEVLRKKGCQKTKSMCREYDENPEMYRSGERIFEFDNGIYNHESVKEMLLAAQNGKCCYCETSFRASSPGHVEHYRPKGEVRQKRGAGRLLPGYYWLAFDWKNLLVSCERCNVKKGSLFPLEDPGARARSHRGRLSAEAPLLVDPSNEEPREHIRFRGAAVEPITKRGGEKLFA